MKHPDRLRLLFGHVRHLAHDASLTTSLAFGVARHRMRLIIALLFVLGCKTDIHDAVEDCPEPADVTIVVKVTLEPETGATIEATCPDGYELVEARCDLGPEANQVLLMSEEQTENGHRCDLWAEHDEQPQSGAVVLTCQPVY